MPQAQRLNFQLELYKMVKNQEKTLFFADESLLLRVSQRGGKWKTRKKAGAPFGLSTVYVSETRI